MTELLRILILEDRPSDAELILREVRREGIEFTALRVETEGAFRRQIEEFRPGLILADYSLPSYDGMSALAVARGECPDVPFILVSGTLGEEAAVESLHQGAMDYVLKQRLSRLGPAVRRALLEVEERNELRRAEQCLRDSEVRYRRLFESAKDGVLILDAETGMVLDVNPFLIDLLGYSREALLGNRIWELGFIADVVANHATFVELQQQGYVRYEDKALRTSDGRSIEVEFVSNAYLVNQGTVIQCNIRDISERKRAEEALRKSEARYRAVTESASDAIILADAMGMIVGWNRGAEGMFGRPEAEALGQPLTLLIPPRFRDRHLEGMKRLRAGGEPRLIGRTAELAGLRKDGTEFPAELSLSSWETPEGRFFTGMIRDVTQRKRAAESQARLAMAVEQAAEAVMITDANATILYANPAFEKITGYTREEVIGQNPRILKSGKQDDAFYKQMWDTLARGRVWAGRLVNRRKDGTLFEEEATISPVRDAAGQIVNYVGVKRDISNETRLEQQLLQAQKMEAVGRLAGGVAHDFNNLLGVIAGYGEIVYRGLAEQDPVKGKVGEILKAADRAASLTRQLLAFSRKQVLQPKILDLNAVVADMEKMLRRLIGEDVDLETRLAPRLGSVQADQGQIEQVLMNLAVNARDAMPDGGQITVETRNADLDADYAAMHRPVRPGPYVLLSVTDTGSGMDAATQARIFEPFFSTKAVGKGTGLGLSTVYGIVKQSEGFIWVYSEVGLGTTFKVYLPRVDVQAPLELEESPRPLRRGSETVLLVEDEASLREMLREVLEASGYSALVARDGTEARQLAEAHSGPIQIMVTDVIMPGMTGPKIAELVAPRRPGMKILYISGYSDESIVRHGLMGPGRAFLSKPFGPELFLRRIRESLDAD